MTFDRYFLVPLVLLLPFVLPRRRISAAAWTLGVILLALNTGLTLYFVDQRIRARSCPWEAGQSLVAEGTPPHLIDSEFEFNTYYAYAYYSEKYGASLDRPWRPWDAPDARFVASSLPRDAAALIPRGEHHCPNHWGLDPRTVHIYKVGSLPPAPAEEDEHDG